jgi:hypothetical protein
VLDAVLDYTIALEQTILLYINELVCIRIECIVAGEEDGAHPSAPLSDMVGRMLRVQRKLQPENLFP